MVTVCWYSRQYVPPDWYVRTGVTVPEWPLSGLFHATVCPDGADSRARCALSAAIFLSRSSRRLPTRPPSRAPPITPAAIPAPPPPAAAAMRPPTAAPPRPPMAVFGLSWTVVQLVSGTIRSSTAAALLANGTRLMNPPLVMWIACSIESSGPLFGVRDTNRALGHLTAMTGGSAEF